jgi:hypothetical protein
VQPDETWTLVKQKRNYNFLSMNAQLVQADGTSADGLTLWTDGKDNTDYSAIQVGRTTDGINFYYAEPSGADAVGTPHLQLEFRILSYSNYKFLGIAESRTQHTYYFCTGTDPESLSCTLSPLLPAITGLFNNASAGDLEIIEGNGSYAIHSPTEMTQLNHFISTDGVIWEEITIDPGAGLSGTCGLYYDRTAGEYVGLAFRSLNPNPGWSCTAAFKSADGRAWSTTSYGTPDILDVGTGYRVLMTQVGLDSFATRVTDYNAELYMTPQKHTANNGAAWTDDFSADDITWKKLLYHGGAFYLLGINTGNSYVLKKSTDGGATWAAAAVPDAANTKEIVSNGINIYALTSTGISYSSNGAAWTAATTSRAENYIYAGGGHVVAWGGTSNNQYQYLSSTAGTHAFTQLVMGGGIASTTNPILNMISDGTEFFAARSGDTYIWNSADITNAITWAGTVYLASGYNTLQQTDLLLWSTASAYTVDGGQAWATFTGANVAGVACGGNYIGVYSGSVFSTNNANFPVWRSRTGESAVSTVACTGAVGGNIIAAGADGFIARVAGGYVQY